MIYHILKSLMRITVKVFFRKVHVRNAEAVPRTGPVIIVANHPSTFMDPIVIAVTLKRPVYFLAKGEVFRSGFAKWLLPKFNMIPVYRKQDDPSAMHKNEETFEKCYEHLEKGGALLIFPEGTSITERKLRKIKTGTARIALGAEAKNNFSLGVQIISIGLNYSNPHKFREELLINIDKPVDASSLKEEYHNDPVNAANALTEIIRDRLEKNIINIETEQLDSLVKNIEIIYKTKLAKEMGYSVSEKEEDFIITKGIADTVEFFQQNDPARVERIAMKVRNYLASLQRIGLTDKMLNKTAGGSLFLSNVRSILFIVIGFPFYLYGLINNYIPFELPAMLARKASKQPEWRGAIAMVAGTFTFLVFYTLQIILISNIFHKTWITVAYGVSLPLSGFFAYYYWHTVLYIRSRWRLISLFWKRARLIAALINERKEIIAEFDKAKEELGVRH